MTKYLWQFAKYMVGGGLYFWTGLLVFSIGYSGLHWQWWQAKLAGDVVGWTLNYLVQRYWAFANKGLKMHEMQHAWRYSLLTGVNFVIDYLIVGGLKLVGISPYIGFFVSSGFFTIWNYVWYRWWVFPERAK
jgi:putative flippase GtrA